MKTISTLFLAVAGAAVVAAQAVDNDCGVSTPEIIYFIAIMLTTPYRTFASPT